MASRVAALSAALALSLAAWAALDPARGGIATLLAALAVLIAGFAWLEGGTLSARDLTLVATLGGLAAAGRVLFAPVPSVQPVTVIVAAAGVALGPRRGFAVGALAALASNFFLGQGPHTPWQMLAWGGCGLLAGLFRPLLRRRAAFVAFVLVLGFAFGTLMDLRELLPSAPRVLTHRVATGLGPVKSDPKRIRFVVIDRVPVVTLLLVPPRCWSVMVTTPHDVMQTQRRHAIHNRIMRIEH